MGRTSPRTCLPLEGPITTADRTQGAVNTNLRTAEPRTSIQPTPKLAFSRQANSGIACALLGLDAATLARDRESLGQLLETFVLQELRRQASWREEPIKFFHFRDRDDFEVDVVLEQGHLAVAGVEVKAAATVGEADFRGLRKLRAAAGNRFACGVVLYDGSAASKFDGGLFAVPIRALWEAS
jgi:uncharacterized protein